MPLSPDSARCQWEYSARGSAKSDPRRSGRSHQLDKIAAGRVAGSRSFCAKVAKRTTAGSGHQIFLHLGGRGRGDRRFWLGPDDRGVLPENSTVPTAPGARTQNQPWPDLGSAAIQASRKVSLEMSFPSINWAACRLNFSTWRAIRRSLLASCPRNWKAPSQPDVQRAGTRHRFRSPHFS